MQIKHLALPTILGTLLAMPARAEGIDILGQHYSQTLKDLVDKVEVTMHKKLVFIASETGGNHIMLGSPEIMRAAPELTVSLLPGLKEDNVAHEVMHALLVAEGFPDMFVLNIDLDLEKFFTTLSSDLHHFIINRRLVEWGYDPQRGFLKATADSDNNYLNLHDPNTPSQNALVTMTALHLLIWRSHYIGDARAESEILKRFPKVAPYWQTLKTDLRALPFKVKPKDLWLLGRSWFLLMDRIAKDINAPIAPLESIGMRPAFIPASASGKPYRMMFSHIKKRDLSGFFHLIFCDGILTGLLDSLPKGRTKMSVKEFSAAATIRSRKGSPFEAVYY